LAQQKLLLIVAPTGGVFTVPEFIPRSPQGETCRQYRRGLQPLPSRSDHSFHLTVTATVRIVLTPTETLRARFMPIGRIDAPSFLAPPKIHNARSESGVLFDCIGLGSV
jgi:hypothetical protein